MLKKIGKRAFLILVTPFALYMCLWPTFTVRAWIQTFREYW